MHAIRFLNLLLEHIPATIVSGWNEGNAGHGSRVLEGYLGLLNAGTKFGETDGKFFMVHFTYDRPILFRSYEGNINSQRGSYSSCTN